MSSLDEKSQSMARILGRGGMYFTSLLDLPQRTICGFPDVLRLSSEDTSALNWTYVLFVLFWFCRLPRLEAALMFIPSCPWCLFNKLLHFPVWPWSWFLVFSCHIVGFPYKQNKIQSWIWTPTLMSIIVCCEIWKYLFIGLIHNFSADNQFLIPRPG